ncbi:MAG: hypothetical protein ACRDYV_02185 [Acidimicrobiia bacterium]
MPNIKTADEIVVGANGSIYVAPVGSTIPASIGAALGAQWFELGYVTEEGVTWVDGKTLQSIRAWQSFYDLRRIVESKEGSIAFQLLQWNGDNVRFAFGGGTVTNPAVDEYRYVPPDPAEIDERALAVEWQDGAKNYRLIYPKGMVSENIETNIVRTGGALLPITFSLLGEEGVDPFIFDTDDPAFANALGS